MAAARRARANRGPVSADEKAARLQRMMADADSHQSARSKQLARDEARAQPSLRPTPIARPPCEPPRRAQAEKEREREEDEARAEAARLDGDKERPNFLDDVARGTFADTNIGSVADRINQQKHYVQRGHRASAENFLKRS